MNRQVITPGDEMMSDESLPPIVESIAREYPDVWEAYGRLGEATEQAGPLDPKTVRLVKLALAIGAGRQGQVHSHARRGLKLGLNPAELRQVALLAVPSLGWSAGVAALSWINDVVKSPSA
jgi:alkylhydroperoxidase/carboxymuconolactone decarboxylase family protein YurZ